MAMTVTQAEHMPRGAFMLVSHGANWRNLLPLLVTALALASGLPAAESGPVLYRTDFEGGPVGSLPPGWAAQGGAWGWWATGTTTVAAIA